MRQRTFYYTWCNRTETDVVCEHCETIVLDVSAGCQHCRQSHERTAHRIAQLKGRQQRREMSETGEFALF